MYVVKNEGRQPGVGHLGLDPHAGHQVLGRPGGGEEHQGAGGGPPHHQSDQTSSTDKYSQIF